MRDRRFVAVRRGGALDVAKHRLLAVWAASCAEHVLTLFEECCSDERPRELVVSAFENRSAKALSHVGEQSSVR